MLGLSVLTYHFVETPLRRATWAPKSFKTIAIGIFACCMAAGFLYALANPLKAIALSAQATVNPLKFPHQRIVQTTLGCHLPNAADPIADCLHKKIPHRISLYVIGDSHASNHVPSIQRAIEQLPEAELRYLIEWGFIKQLTGSPACKQHSQRPCIDRGFSRQIDFFKENLKEHDIVFFLGRAIELFATAQCPAPPTTLHWHNCGIF